jgi:acyl-CoA synthetase (NDP forming)
MAVDRLLRPGSIAIVGASDKIGPGFNAWNALKTLGYDGAIHLVNPGRRELLGLPCHASLLEVPGTVDAVFIAVQAEKVADVAREAAAKGAGGLAVLSSGFTEAGERGADMQRSLAALARAHDMAVCGPNCLGFLNFADRTALFGTSLPGELPVGRTAAIVQSGSIGIALLNAARGLGLSHLITSGNEAVTTVADYLAALVDAPTVETFVVFLEQLRQPRAFIAACQRARTLGKPVIVLKSGRTGKGRQAVAAHTGAVAGSVEASEAALRAAGVIQVFSLDELIETAVAFSALPAPRRRARPCSACRAARSRWRSTPPMRPDCRCRLYPRRGTRSRRSCRRTPPSPTRSTSPGPASTTPASPAGAPRRWASSPTLASSCCCRIRRAASAPSR